MGIVGNSEISSWMDYFGIYFGYFLEFVWVLFLCSLLVMGYHFGWAFCLALIGRNVGFCCWQI
jgi:hypothetical protein